MYIYINTLRRMSFGKFKKCLPLLLLCPNGNDNAELLKNKIIFTNKIIKT